MTSSGQDGLRPWEPHGVEPYAPGVLMQMAAAPEPEERRDYASLFYRRRWVMLATLLIVLGLGMLYTFTRRPVYESSARIVVASVTSQGTLSEQDVPLLGDVRALTRSRSVDTQVEMISSPDLIKEAFISLRPEVRESGFGGDTIPPWAIRVTARKNTDVILITGRAYTPGAAAALANMVRSLYFRRDMARNSQAVRQARRFAGEEMAVAGKQLSSATADLAAFKRKTGFFAPDAQLAKAAEQAVQLSMDLDAAKAQLAAERRQVAAMGRELRTQDPNVTTNTTVGPNPQYDAILQRIDTLNSQRAALLQEFVPESREVRDIDERIKAARARLAQVASTVVASTVQSRNPVRDNLLPTYASLAASVAADTARVRALESALAEKKGQTLALPERERGLTERMQRVSMLQHTYELLTNKYNALLLAEQATLPTAMLVANARAADQPSYPSRKKNAALFFLLGALAAVGAALLADRVDRRVHDEQDAEQMTHLPSLSVVPVANGSPLLVAPSGADGAILESFRMLRNSIAFSGQERQVKVTAVTSPGRQEGKSTTSVNLAVAMSLEGRRVLLVDADMHRPSLHRLMGTSNDLGLSTVLAGQTPPSKAVSATTARNVYCMPAGPLPPNAAELLGSQASRELFRRLADEWDAVVVDCPPAAGLSDVQVISRLVDGVLLVVSMSQTLKPQLEFTIRALRQAGAPVIGVVINRMPKSHTDYGYYYSRNAEPAEPDEPEIADRI